MDYNLKQRFMNKYLPLYTLILASFMTFVLFTSYTDDKKATTASSTEASTTVASGSLPQIIKSVNLNKSFSFAGEDVPMDNFDARERLDRELTVNSYRHSATIQYIKLANRYFPYIERELAKNGMPDDIKYLAVAESGLRHAVSPAGAKGLWQFMKGTGKDYDLEINSEIDERYHVEKSTAAAIKYLKKLKNRHGKWTLAAAAYNMGSAGLSRDMSSQGEEDYYDLNLNQETGRYVFRILALKEILSNPSEFGFLIDQESKYPPLDQYYTVDVNKIVPSWGKFAEEYGISYRMLKVYNPWIISSSLKNVSGTKTYKVKIPKRN